MAKIQTRLHIINTASELFYRNGYNATGINEIIEKSGIAKATLYSHFKSKEDLCIAYLDHRDDILLKKLSAYVNKKSRGNKRLVGIIEFLLSFFESEEFNGCWCLRTKAEIAPDNIKIKNKILSSKSTILSYIESLVIENRPTLKKSQQVKLSKRIYLLYECAVSESYLHSKVWPIKENIEMLKLILKSTH